MQRRYGCTIIDLDGNAFSKQTNFAYNRNQNHSCASPLNNYKTHSRYGTRNHEMDGVNNVYHMQRGKRNQFWMAMAYASLKHYGLGFAIMNQGEADMHFQVTFTAYVQFREVNLINNISLKSTQKHSYQNVMPHVPVFTGAGVDVYYRQIHTRIYESQYFISYGNSEHGQLRAWGWFWGSESPVDGCIAVCQDVKVVIREYKAYTRGTGCEELHSWGILLPVISRVGARKGTSPPKSSSRRGYHGQRQQVRPPPTQEKVFHHQQSHPPGGAAPEGFPCELGGLPDSRAGEGGPGHSPHPRVCELCEEEDHEPGESACGHQSPRGESKRK